MPRIWKFSFLSTLCFTLSFLVLLGYPGKSSFSGCALYVLATRRILNSYFVAGGSHFIMPRHHITGNWQVHLFYRWSFWRFWCRLWSTNGSNCRIQTKIYFRFWSALHQLRRFELWLPGPLSLSSDTHAAWVWSPGSQVWAGGTFNTVTVVRQQWLQSMINEDECDAIRIIVLLLFALRCGASKWKCWRWASNTERQ